MWDYYIAKSKYPVLPWAISCLYTLNRSWRLLIVTTDFVILRGEKKTTIFTQIFPPRSLIFQPIVTKNAITVLFIGLTKGKLRSTVKNTGAVTQFTAP